MTQEQIEEINKQKDKLLELVSPAIKQFISETGMNPTISVSIKEDASKCGTIKSSNVYVSCWI